jgi:hypothetical protein
MSSAAELLGVIAQLAEPFSGPDGRLWVRFPDGIAQREVTSPVRGRRFSGWLRRVYYDREGKPAPNQAMSEAISTTEARALAGPTHPVYVRVGEYGDSVVIDLVDDAWRAVVVDRHGWRIVERPPVRFFRAPGMLALPAPVNGGAITDLRPFVNLGDNDEAWRLLVAWLVMALCPRGPYPILVLGGEQGSAKTWTSSRLRDLTRTRPRRGPNPRKRATSWWPHGTHGR